MTKICVFSFITTFAIISSSVSANEKITQETKRYQKCYSIFARALLSQSDSILLKVKSGKISGAEACMMLVGRADLDETTGILKTKDQLSKTVLKTFNDFHRNWFSQYEFTVDTNCVKGTEEIFDSGEASYYVSKALFTKTPFSSIVTADKSLKALRESDSESKRIRDTYYLNPSANQARERKLIIGQPVPGAEDDDKFSGVNLPIISTGELIGITHKESLNLSGLATWETKSYPNATLNKTVNVFKNFGSGIVTSTPYLLMNSGQLEKFKSDGGMGLRRRWSQHLIKDLLCRDLPVVRPGDAISHLDTEDTSELPFRKGLSCMQCHSTMDQLARPTRNLLRGRSANSCTFREGWGFAYMHEFNPTQSPHSNEKVGWIDSSDKDFYKRPPHGKFYYRTTKGELIDENISNLDDLGKKLAATDDLYICAAKRYVKFLTGVDVPMFDPGDISSPEVNQAEQEYIDYIQQLGEDLKKNGDLKKTIQSIVSNKIFLDPSQRPNR